MVKRNWFIVIAIMFSAVFAMCIGAGWTADAEYVNDERMRNLREEYEWSIVYIRLLALTNERLHAEKKLEVLTRLHEKLVNNKSITFTEIDLYSNEFRLNVDTKTKSLLDELAINGRKAVFTGEGGLLPWVKMPDNWFIIER